MNYLSNFGNFFIRPFFGTSSASDDVYDIQVPNELSFIRESKDIGLDVEEFDFIALDLTSKKIYNLKLNKHDSAEIIGQKFHKQFGISNFSITYNYIFEPCEPLDEIQLNVSQNIHSNNLKNNENGVTKSCKDIGEFGDSYKSGELLSDYDILLPTDTNDEIDVTESCKNITNFKIDESKKENVLNEIRKNVVEVESDAKSENHSFEIAQNISNENSSIESENDEEDCQVHGCGVKEKHVHVERLNFDGTKLEDGTGKEISLNTKILINGEICIDGDSKSASTIIPKIHENSKIVTLSFYDQKIFWYKLKPLLTDSTKEFKYSKYYYK
uniref:Uncharacterized protein n=1 Tax=Panagrolaimus davidi TaxID=227884 RepID=A0A914PRB5_9BILA